MTIELADPPREPKYGKLMKKIVEADGAWLRVSADEVAPNLGFPGKQNRVWIAAKSHGIKVQTTVQEGALYVRPRKEQA